MWAANHPDIRRSEYHRQLAIRQETQRPPTCIPVQLKSVVKCTHDGNYMQQETDVLWRTIEENISEHFYTLLTSWFRLTCLLQSCHEYYCRGEKSEWILTKVPNYNEKLRNSVTVQEFFFASFEFSPSEFKRSNASTSTDYIWSHPDHC